MAQLTSFERIAIPQGAVLAERSVAAQAESLFGGDVPAVPRGSVEAPGGRGSVRFFTVAGREFVLRRYLRGGLAARFSRDGYLWLGESRTRSFRELRLLGRLADMGLPVPRPVAARYRRSGLFYRGELVTERLPGASSLASRWLAGEASDADWSAAGRCIRRFHDAGVRHADLNAHNVMLDGSGSVWLLDFDRGRVVRPGAWRERVLARLARSLGKIAASAGRGEEWRAGFALLMQAHDACPVD